MKHAFFILVIISIIVTGIFLPYVHGDYDYFAVGLSYIFQSVTFVSLLLVPTGLLWCILDFINRKNYETVKYPLYFRRIALVVGGIIILAAALGAFVSHNRFSAMIILGLGAYTLLAIHKKGRGLQPASSVWHQATPYYFIMIPLTVLTIRMAFLETVKNSTTDFVIRQSEQLIQDIEAYKKTNGHYPLSLQSTIEDYKTSVSGIERFHYEPSGQAYNLYFEQFSDIIGTEEIVMYNKLDEHEMTVHNQDLLRIAPENIQRGYHRVVELPQEHWKVFYFD
jgi:hypothetical protein